MATITSILKKLTYLTIKHGLVINENFINRYYELAQLKQLLDELRINCVLDVGANVGQFAKELRMIGYEGYILSFEPVPQVYDALKNTFKDDKYWRGYNLALGSVKEKKEIHYITGHSDFSSILKPTQKWKEIQMVEIEIQTLDELYESLVSDIPNPRVFLKMDTQGYDLQVFRGANKNLKNILGLHSEIALFPIYDGAPSYIESLNEYNQAGFSIQHISKLNPQKGEKLIELNCFMKRNDIS